MATTKVQAKEHFDHCVLPALIEHYGKSDKVAIRQGWSEYTDFLCKSGEITQKQYATWTNPY